MNKWTYTTFRKTSSVVNNYLSPYFKLTSILIAHLASESFSVKLQQLLVKSFVRYEVAFQSDSSYKLP